VVSNIRLAIQQRDRHAATLSDTGLQFLTRGYAAHYCAVPREVDPQIVACSMIASGLRIFDIRDPLHPREVAYHVAQAKAGAQRQDDKQNAAMSKPAFVPERREVWYTDVNNGFHVVRLDPSVWPDPTGPTAAPCIARRSVLVTLRGRPRLRSFSVSVNGRRVRASLHRRGVLRVPLPKTGPATAVVRVRAVTRGGRTLQVTKRYALCPAARAAGRAVPTRWASEQHDVARTVDLLCQLWLGGLRTSTTLR
jgi:hypothetical protein